MLDSGFQSPGFRIPQAQNSWIPEFGFPYMWRYIVYQDTQFKCQRNYHRHSDNNDGTLVFLPILCRCVLLVFVAVNVQGYSANLSTAANNS